MRRISILETPSNLVGNTAIFSAGTHRSTCLVAVAARIIVISNAYVRHAAPPPDKQTRRPEREAVFGRQDHRAQTGDVRFWHLADI